MRKNHLIPILMVLMIYTIILITVPKVKETFIVADKDVVHSEIQELQATS